MPHSKNSKEIVDASKTHASTESSGALRSESCCRPSGASSRSTCGRRPDAVIVDDSEQASFTVETPPIGGESSCSTSSTGTPTL